MISKVIIERFKGIERLELNLEPGVSVLIGNNNSGKSSVLQAIQFAVSVSQSSKIKRARWIKKDGRCPTSLSTEDLIYTPLRDISSLAYKGELKEDKKKAIRIEFHDKDGNNAIIIVRKGRNRNISTEIIGERLGKELQNIENPFSIIVPGLSGIPPSEEYKAPSIIRKAAAKGDANNVFRNILYLLTKIDGWDKFQQKFHEIFPNYSVQVEFDPDKDESLSVYLQVKESEIAYNLPIDASGTGILQCIQLLAYYYLYKPKILMIDEPDAHLHPGNQRLLANLLTSMAEDEDIQIIITTHSRHLLHALEGKSKIFWLSNFTLMEKDANIRKILFDLGALERADQLKDGSIKCVVLTEDTKTSMLEMILKASGFDLSETQIWPYRGVTKIDTVRALTEFINDIAPGTQVVIHRDRDFMSEEDIESYKKRLNITNIHFFVTKGNDIEWYFTKPEHISKTYGLSLKESKKKIDQVFKERKSDIEGKCIDIVYQRRLQKWYNQPNDKKPSPSEARNKCTELLTKREYWHGKILLKGLRNLLQKEGYEIKKLENISSALEDEELKTIARNIWPKV